MKILGIDTSTKFLSLGAYDGSKVYEYNIDLGIRHSSLLVPAIKRVSDALGWQVGKIDYFACGIGPGSFTGLRVGVSTIKGLSLALKKPILGISTLDILASNVKKDACVAAIIDAKRSLTYCCIYEIKKNSIKRKTPYMLLSKEELFKKLKDNSVIIGDAAGLYKEEILARIKGADIMDKEYWYPKGRCIIEAALERIKDKKFYDSFNIEPIYLYTKECQIRSQRL